MNEMNSSILYEGLAFSVIRIAFGISMITLTKINHEIYHSNLIYSIVSSPTEWFAGPLKKAIITGRFC